MLDIEIDKLTNSVELAVSGETFNTLVLPLHSIPKKGFRKRDWLFDWGKEMSEAGRRVFKLVTADDMNLILGLISISHYQDHTFMHLIESAKFNKGPQKRYLGVAGNLIAYACKEAFENGFSGIVVFESKTSLITYYQKAIGAKILSGHRMFIDSKESYLLVKQYFK
jgi:hypothetical protein